MNTAKQMLWLPTIREEKYKAKQAIDTFFVRAGDVLSAGLVFAGTQWLALDVAGLGRANVVLVIADTLRCGADTMVVLDGMRYELNVVSADGEFGRRDPYGVNAGVSLLFPLYCNADGHEGAVVKRRSPFTQRR